MTHNTHEILKNVTNRVVHDLTSRPKLNYSLLGGDFGEVLYLYSTSQQGLCERQIADSCLDSILASIRYQPLCHTYCNGLSGLCVGLNWLEKSGYAEGVSESIGVYDKILSAALIKMLSTNLDFLHGAIGIGLYFTMRASAHPEASILLNKILHHLYSNAIQHKSGGLYWKYPDRYGMPEENLSLSHGICSTALFLVRVCKISDGDERTICLRLLRGIAIYLKSFLANPTILGSYTPMPSNGNKSRLGWCYGDIGTSIALRAIGDTLEDEELKRLSYNIAVHIALYRNNLPSDYVLDACQCHGASGIAHFVNNCSRYYRESLFEDAFSKWRDITLGMYQFIDDEYMFGNFHFEDNRIHRNLSLLEGDSGVALMLIGEYSLIDNLLLYEY